MKGDLTAGEAGDAPRGSGAFEVHLDVFEGPFDLLLGLISKHKLDITEVALSQVTDEFIAYIRHRAGGWDLDQVSYFLVVAATLLDLKAARLLPSGEVEDEEDLALLEARDLLFARLLQYRAYKEVAAVFAGRMAAAAKRFPRRVPLEPRFAELLPEVLFTIGPQEFAALAARALTPKTPPTVSVDHIHAAFVSIREQAVLIAGRLRGLQAAVVGGGGELRDRRVVPRPARALPRGRGGVRAGSLARRPVRNLDRRRPRGKASPPGRQVRRRGIGNGNRRRRLHMTSDFTGDGSVAGSPDDESADAVAAPPRLTEDTGPAAGDGDDGPGLRASLEAILLVADQPVPEVLIAQVLERPRHEVAGGLRALSAEYANDGRGFDLREIAGGWRFYTREDCAPLVERFVRDGQEVRLTQAALETLAVIAYRQPVSRARVSAVRGVNCDGVIRTLVLRGLVEDSGTDPETGAILYRTTGYFLERLGMASLDELPDLAPFLPENIEDIEDNERTRA
jgi:segregation and condensation protein A